MALILTIGHSYQCKLESMKDAQQLLEILERATPVKDVHWDHRDKCREQFGKTITINTDSNEKIKISMCSGEPISQEDYQQFVENFTPEKQQEAA
jgi:hypothetical protein